MTSKIEFSWSGSVSVSPSLNLELSRTSKALGVLVEHGVATGSWKWTEGCCPATVRFHVLSVLMRLWKHIGFPLPFIPIISLTYLK